MRQADLARRDAARAKVDEPLRREERAVGSYPRQRHALEYARAEELEAAIDVTPTAGEEQADDAVVHGRDDEPAPRIGALDAIPDHRVDAGRERRREALEVGDVELL